MSGENETNYLSEDELFEGSLEKINGRIAEIVRTEVEKAVAAEREQKGQSAEGEEEKQTQTATTLTREQLDSFDPETLDYAVFKDDDEDVRDTARALFEREVKKLPDGATQADVNAVAEKVSKRLAKMTAAKAKETEEKAGDGVYGDGPLPMNTAGAAAAHIKDEEPKTIEDAEALADKIAKSFK